MGRAAKSFSQLKNLHSANPRGYFLSYLCSPETTVPNLFRPGTPSGKPFLPPSFHVPAIFDALRSSNRYSSLTRLMPGEADAFCAQHLFQHGGTVLTSDSDLLIHDLGKGRVVFFRDIYLDGKSRVACADFRPAEICTRLGLSSSSDSCRFAYERKSSPHSTLPQILRACKVPVIDKVGYLHFCREYLDHEVAPSPLSTQGQPLPIATLDPRISELVLQFSEEIIGEGVEEAMKIFLPILVEDPTRGSSWEQSTPVRQLAYTATRWKIPGKLSTVQEYRRVNNLAQKGRVVHLLPKEQAYAFSVGMLDLMTTLSITINPDSQAFWITLSLILDIRECSELGKQSHSLQVLQHAAKVAPVQTGKVQWDMIHFVAHLQAYFYSIRMLKQILSLDRTKPFDSLGQLRTRLSSFPEITHFPTVQSTLEFISNAKELGETLRTITKLVPLAEVVLEPQSMKKVTKNKKNAAGQKTGHAKISAATKNLFDLLSDS